MTRVTWRPMTDDERDLAHELRGCTFIPGSFDKRFARTVAAQAAEEPRVITDKQARLLRILHHKYRRQIRAHRCTEFCRLNELSGAV